MASQVNAVVIEKLTQLGVETRFHELLAELCAGEVDYLSDIVLSDLEGKCDANGSAIPPPVARGLLRKIAPKDLDKQTEPLQALDVIPSTAAMGNCSVTLRRGNGDYASMVRCTVQGQLNQSQGGSMRRKVLTAVLDNSGSMRNEWPLVVDAITRVFTDELLQDPFVSLSAIVYSTSAKRVVLPDRASELSNILLTKFAPGGITNFESAFQLAEQTIKHEVNKHIDNGICPSAIDVTTLVFTDGEDTSVPPTGSTSPAATAKARAAGDKFRNFLNVLGCSSHTCIAAFGEHHNPEQCQYLSDRYYYINRKEVLSEWLTGSLAELLQSAGHCSVQVQLPSALTLAEPLPKRIGLDPNGSFEREFWMYADLCNSDCTKASIIVQIEDSGTIALRGVADLHLAAVVDTEDIEGRLFLLDAGEMQLRQIALELRGRKPSRVELARLRERLVGVKELVQPMQDVVIQPTARVFGRGLLRARLEELETRRKRLSYALGHFDEDDQDTRHLGVVGIDAVLRDASQYVTLGAIAAECARIAKVASSLPLPDPLSLYGQSFTLDVLSGCNAEAAAKEGDAMFFPLRNVLFSTDGQLASLRDGGCKCVSYETFMLLSNNGSAPICLDGEDFTHLGLPVFATAGHFLRIKLLLPKVLGCLSANGTYTAGASEHVLLQLLGGALNCHVSACTSPDIALLHKVRSVFAVFESTELPGSSKSLIDDVSTRVNEFIDDPSVQVNTGNLFEVLAAGLLAKEYLPQHLARLGEAVVMESARRAVRCKLQNATESECLKLAWSLLGPKSNGDAWLDEPWQDSISGNLVCDFDILKVGAELEKDELNFPGEHAPRDEKVLPQILNSRLADGTPQASEWGKLCTLLAKWASVLEKWGGATGLWQRLDALMTDTTPLDDEQIQEFAALLDLSQPWQRLKDILPYPQAFLTTIASECLRALPKIDKETLELPPRLAAATAVRQMVARREAMARKYPITGADYPSAHPLSAEFMREMWGAAAEPVNEQLHKEVRNQVHSRNPTLSLTVKEALADKEYRKRGGRFAFPTPVDTFIPGLHRRTKDLHESWKKNGKTSGSNARAKAVEEMLLRLRWDDRDHKAYVKLSKIVARIWDDLEGVAEKDVPLSSALWLDAQDPNDATAMTEDAKDASGNNLNSKVHDNEDDWTMVLNKA